MKKKLLSLLLGLCMAFALLPPSTASARGWTREDTIAEGWYHLRAMNNYLNFNADGEAELRKLSDNAAFYVESKGDNRYTLKLENGKYLGLEEDAERKDGTRVKAVSEPYVWMLYWEATNFNRTNSDLFNLRVPENQKLVMNASGQSRKDGTAVIVWTHKELPAPEHARFRFIPADKDFDPTGESWKVYSVGERATKNYKEGFKDKNGKVVIKAQFDRVAKFSGGLAKVNKGGKAGFINTKGKLVTKLKYNFAACQSTFSDGLLRVGTVTKGKSKFGYIDTTGKEVIPVQFDQAYAFSDGLAAVGKYQGEKSGLEYYKIGWINTKGKLVIPYKYGGENLYNALGFKFEDGLGMFVKYLGAAGIGADGMIAYAPTGLMNKKGKVIIPADPDRRYDPAALGFQWKDGVIVNNYEAEVNAKGVPTKGGGHSWSFVELYDYSGKLIKKLDGYRMGVPLGGGYVLAMHELNEGEKVEYLDTWAYESYWTVFDRDGNIIFDKQAKNDYYVLGGRADGFTYGYDNGYIYFAETRVKVSDATVTPAP